MNEIWKPIPDWPMYSASNMGVIVRTLTQHGKPIWRIKNPKPQPNGYLRVGLTNRTGNRLDIGIHQLILLTFTGSCPKGEQVNHKDGNKQNNKLNNLEYVTARQNIQHAVTIGLFPRGERQHLAKLTPEKVREMRSKRANGALLRELAEEYGMSICPVNQVCKRITWKHIN